MLAIEIIKACFMIIFILFYESILYVFKKYSYILLFIIIWLIIFNCFVLADTPIHINKDKEVLKLSYNNADTFFNLEEKNNFIINEIIFISIDFDFNIKIIHEDITLDDINIDYDVKKTEIIKL